MGASTFQRLLEKHFPRVSICPHKEDYCDTCKAMGVDISRCAFTIKKIRDSGNSSEDRLRPHEKELATLKGMHQDHLLDVKLAQKFYNKMVARCKEDWSKQSTVEGGTDSNRHSFTLVLSADYQQAKLTPYWGRSPHPASTYYLMKESHDVFGIVDQRDDSGHVQLFSEQLGPKNTDHTVSLLQAYIEDIKSKHPWLKRVMTFLDNATNTNKNHYLLGWAIEAVERGLISSIHMFSCCWSHKGFTRSIVRGLLQVLQCG